MEFVLKTHNLTKIYNRETVLEKVDINIEKGSIYGLIGNNGAGKTTIMKIITGLLTQTSGEVTLFDNKHCDFAYSNIGSLIEHPGLYLHMTAVQNIQAFSKLNISDEGYSFEELLKLVGLDHAENKKVKSYSLGMKQRLGIAIALIGKPKFLIMDEPTNGLDPSGIRDIRNLLLDLNKNQSVTILISSHILGELNKLATCFGVINSGVMIKEFSKTELNFHKDNVIEISVEDVSLCSEALKRLDNKYTFVTSGENTLELFGDIEETELITNLENNGIKIDLLSKKSYNEEEYFLKLMGVF